MYYFFVYNVGRVKGGDTKKKKKGDVRVDFCVWSWGKGQRQDGRCFLVYPRSGKTFAMFLVQNMDGWAS